MVKIGREIKSNPDEKMPLMSEIIPSSLLATACEDLSRRADATTVGRQRRLFELDATTRVMLDAVPSPLLILNRHRQIVFANEAARALAPDGNAESLFGRRPGEALDCLHARACAEGCGQAEACRVCGLGRSATEGLSGAERTSECRLTREGERPVALDLRVRLRPIESGGERFVVAALADISDEKRRAALEKIFFHDLMNTVGSFRGFVDLLAEGMVQDRGEIVALLQATAQQAIEEIAAQRTLSMAESGELKVRREVSLSNDFLRQTLAMFGSHPAAEGKILLLDPDLAAEVLETDLVLLRRILANLLLNALEASAPGETVRAGCRIETPETISFRVHNAAVIPDEVRLQLFQRSFTTKGTGRGLGTYSVRLLAGYLQGAVTLTSTPQSGTEFRVTLPLRLP